MSEHVSLAIADVRGVGRHTETAELSPNGTREGLGRQKLIPGEPGLWLLLICDLMQFSLFFALFSYHRGREPELFEASARNLHIGLGFVNTIVLIVGSVLVAVAIDRWRGADSHRLVSRMLFATGVLGLVFVTIKIVEYMLSAHAGHTIGSNDFYMFYFCLTGFHLVHVIAGSVALFIVARAVSNGRVTPSPEKRGTVYSVGLFWHMVDLVWLLLFSLLYIS
ncbi:cytochrome c oxidase subunit 3 [Mycolicibacterium moriokaense]|uniref:Probable cytochrome c oxidase subunit 3 n=1 Tax=Mycolicibacterium moriokaense TaxID=39691 RepID=A0AAD1H8K0_9MYCO|nr:cytochrome c oxidase subunit 3 [Mycolicibacterium moriokaense]MCV7039177.1 cytochrome c oxidase subunit 3 [Mycolicibacterium moriokaense]BBX00081.1 cytochrome c oxidase subunit III [Mycolicibacterium moriokaense]